MGVNGDPKQLSYKLQFNFHILFLSSDSEIELEYLRHSQFSSVWRTTLTSVQCTVAHLHISPSLSSYLSFCLASNACACSFLFVLVSVFLTLGAPAVMPLGSFCWRAVGSAGIMDREGSNVTAD